MVGAQDWYAIEAPAQVERFVLDVGVSEAVHDRGEVGAAGQQLVRPPPRRRAHMAG